MPSFSADLSWSERNFTGSVSTGRRFTRQIEVLTDDPVNTYEKDVIEWLGTTFGFYLGVPFPGWPWATLTEWVGCKPHPENPAMWLVDMLFEEPAASPGTMTSPGSPPPGVPLPPSPPPPPPGTPPQPGDRDPTIRISYRLVETYQTVDLDNKPIVNVWGDPFENPPPIFRTLTVYNYTIYRQPGAWSEALGEAILNKINLLTWRGKPPDTCKIESCNGILKAERGFRFWEIPMVIVYDPEKWTPTWIANTGRRATPRGGPHTVDNLTPILDSGTTALLRLVGDRWQIGDTFPSIAFRFHDRIDFTGL